MARIDFRLSRSWTIWIAAMAVVLVLAPPLHAVAQTPPVLPKNEVFKPGAPTPATAPGTPVTPAIDTPCPGDSDEVRAQKIRVADLRDAARTAETTFLANVTYYQKVRHERGDEDPETRAALALMNNSRWDSNKKGLALSKAQEKLANLGGTACPPAPGTPTPATAPGTPVIPKAATPVLGPTPVQPLTGEGCYRTKADQAQIDQTAKEVARLKERQAVLASAAATDERNYETLSKAFASDDPKVIAAKKVLDEDKTKLANNATLLKAAADKLAVLETKPCTPRKCRTEQQEKDLIFYEERAAKRAAQRREISARAKIEQAEYEKLLKDFGKDDPRTKAAHDKWWQIIGEGLSVGHAQERAQNQVDELESMDQCPAPAENPPPAKTQPAPPAEQAPPTKTIGLGTPRLYLRGGPGVTVLRDNDQTTHFDDGSATETLGSSTGFNVGTALGVQSGAWRFEGEAGYRRNNASTLTAVADPPIGGYTQAFSFMANAIYDFTLPPEWGTWTPHLGAGAGVAQVSTRQNFAGVQFFSSRDTQFAYQLIAGIRYPVSDSWAVDLDYRYLATPGLNYRDLAGNRVSSNYATHNVVVSLSYLFGAP